MKQRQWWEHIYAETKLVIVIWRGRAAELTFDAEKTVKQKKKKTENGVGSNKKTVFMKIKKGRARIRWDDRSIRHVRETVQDVKMMYTYVWRRCI